MKKAILLIGFILLVSLSCNKEKTQITIKTPQKVEYRIVQYDLDGDSTISNVILTTE